ncbi:MAG: MFS transporter [Planctomycetaceae bacterium]|nr:MFS transporter [Planctomycetaceae bacterium]
MDDLGTACSGLAIDVRDDAPTNVRWRILALLMAYAGLVHFNRISISVAGTEHLMKEFSLTEAELGKVYTAYLVVYTLCMIPGGWLIDRFGPKKSLMFLGFGTALVVPLTGLTSFATAGSILVVLYSIRAVLGVISAPMHPGAARAVSFWIPNQTRGVANSLVTAAAVIGIASTYFIFGILSDYLGWPSAFLVGGVATLMLTIVWSAYGTDHPGQHRGVNAAERALIEAGDPSCPVNLQDDSNENGTGSSLGRQPHEHVAPRSDTARGLYGPIFWMLRNRSLVLLSISYATVSYFQYLFFYWMQHYFDKVLELGKTDGRLYATIVTLAMAAGMLCGGWIADRMQSRFGVRRGRAIAPVCGMIASALLLIMGIFGSQPVWVVTCFALAMYALGASEASFWLTGIELGRERGGLSAAILNAGGNAGGIPAPYITPLFSEYFGWQYGLGLASVLCLFGAVLWWWIDPDEGREPAVA